jgi:hypothetical protein
MARIFVRHVWRVAVLAAIPYLCYAQEKPFLMPLVPAANWRQVDFQVIPLQAVGKFGGDPVVEKEYGVKAIELRTYQLGKTRTQVVVEATPNTTAAYGLLTFYQTPEMIPEKDIDFALSDPGETLMARGSKFIRFLHGQDSPPSASDFQALLLFVGGSKPSASALETMPHPMPSKGLLPGSEKYLLGLEAAKRALPSFRADLVGFEQSAEVQLAQYQMGKVKPILMSISYPTPQMARLRFKALTNLLGLNREQGEDSIYGRRSGSYVFLALNAKDAGTAAALMDLFQVTEGVSWDQKYITERSLTLQVVHMILAILVLTAILIGACLVAGVLFFLSRRFAAKFFPNSQWGHADDDQLIRLNLKT